MRASVRSGGAKQRRDASAELATFMGIEMDSFAAFAMAEVNRGKELIVFDWIKAAQIIKDRGAQSASAGPCGDWDCTGGEIYRDGKPVPQDEAYTFLASTWATPELEIDGDVADCLSMQSATPGWDSSTYWPTEALALLWHSDSSMPHVE